MLFLRIGVIFGREKVLFYTLLNQCNTTDKHNHTHTKKRYLAVISHSTRFKEINRKKQQQKHRISFKSFRESRHAMLVLALQNFARVVSLSSLNKLHIRYFIAPLESNYGWLEFFPWSHRIWDNESQLYFPVY